jgi:hypothetical protein
LDVHFFRKAQDWEVEVVMDFYGKLYGVMWGGGGGGGGGARSDLLISFQEEVI